MIEKGYTLSTGGTENHLMLIDLRDKKITGSKVEYILEKVNISVNKNAIVGDKMPFHQVALESVYVQ